MSRPPSRKPRYSNDFTQKLRFCKGCHNELRPDMKECPVCGTPVPDPTGADSGPIPLPENHDEDESDPSKE